MKKILLFMFSIFVLFLVTGCTRDLCDIIDEEPSITGVVLEVNESSCLIESNGSQYVVSTDVEYKDSFTNLAIGDEVNVYYDGVIAESYPAQIHHVYAIFLRTPEK